MTIEFHAYFIMFLALVFGLTCLWVIYDLDRDDKKERRVKTKKA